MSLDFSLYLNCEDAGDGEQHSLDVLDKNITHNVSRMWREAGCYEALYKSEGDRAKDHLEAVQKAITAMLGDPQKYKAMEPDNGWGDYRGAVEWLQEVRDAMEQYPLARIHVFA